jgi:isocitrate dehydrogenase
VLKGPMNTPIGGGYRSINVAMRKMFDLFACIRPVKTFAGVETPLKANTKVDVVIFRENTEDVYAGIEFEKGSPQAEKLRKLLAELGATVPPDAGLGIKTISESASKRIVAKAIQYALDNNRPSVTIMHKGNIQKYTEGAFLKWGQEVAKQQFPGKVILSDEFKAKYGGDFSRVPQGKVVLNDVIADNMFQQMTLNPQHLSVIVAPNLNGDYISDDAVALVGGLGLAPGANIGEKHAMFEATHGTAPDIAGQNKANPTALFLTTVMMLNHMGWSEAADLLLKGVEQALASHRMTGDLARHIPGAKALSTDQYTDAVIDNMRKSAAAGKGGNALPAVS